MRAPVAALYVRADGPYPALVADWWDEQRDARLYAGPLPVVAHPPCARWSRYWSGGPSAKVRRVKGDDGGCFAAALASVVAFGGVLEHPEASHAWAHHGINKPPRHGGWISAGVRYPGAWTCCVEQGHYGHRSRKATWLFYVGAAPPSLTWGKSEARIKMDLGYLTAAERRAAVKRGATERLSKRERELTPEPFARLLVELAKGAR